MTHAVSCETGQWQGQKGLTLLELMLSFALLALVVLSAYYVLISALQMSEEARYRLLALNAARSTLEAVKDTPLQNISSITTDDFVPADLPNGTITILTNPNPVGNAVLATVTVRVGYTGAKNMPRQLEITTMRSRF